MSVYVHVCLHVHVHVQHYAMRTQVLNRVFSTAFKLPCTFFHFFLAATSAPMSPWNDSALVNQQMRLMNNVRLAPQLQYMLEQPAGGFMTQAEAESVTSKTSDSEQMAQVIRILRGKGNNEFRVFCELLQRSNYGLWAEELQKAAEDFKLRGHHCNSTTI